MTHQTNPSNPSDPYEKCAIQFQLPNAIIWQIKFILSSVSSKKSLASASSEFNTVSINTGATNLLVLSLSIQESL